MKIQYASDLHLEFSCNRDFLKANPIKPIGDILVLAGDIITFNKLKANLNFFKYVSDNFKTVYYIAGNHEWYESDLMKFGCSYFEKITGNCYLVNNTSIIDGGVNLIFSTLWTKISEANKFRISHALNDFKLIKNNGQLLTVDLYNKMHLNSLNFIKKEVKLNTSNKVVVVTHHVPTFMNFNEKYKSDPVNEAFAVELYNYIADNPIDAWIYGHTHFNTPEFSIGKCKMLTNQLGYVIHNEHIIFNNSAVIEI